MSISKRFQSYFALILAALSLVSVEACSGMSGLGLGGSNLATDSNDSRKVSDDGNNGNNNGGDRGNPAPVPEFHSAENPPPGITPIGPGAPEGGPTSSVQFNGNAATLASNGTPSGYRPGSEGQVQHGPNVFVSVSGLDGRTNCKKPFDAPFEELFTDGSTPTLYYWLSNDENGADAKGFFKPVNEYGKIAFYCNEPSDPMTQFKYVVLLASYTDAQGKVHRSETTTNACPDILKSESAEFCLTLQNESPALQAKPGAIDTLLRNSEPSTVFKARILGN